MTFRSGCDVLPASANHPCEPLPPPNAPRVIPLGTDLQTRFRALLLQHRGIVVKVAASAPLADKRGAVAKPVLLGAMGGGGRRRVAQPHQRQPARAWLLLNALVGVLGGVGTQCGYRRLERAQHPWLDRIDTAHAGRSLSRAETLLQDIARLRRQ